MEFDLDFLVGNVRYNYGFHATATAFEKEWLFSYPKNSPRKLFVRESDRFEFGPTLKGQNNIISSLTRTNSLFLSAAAQNNHEALRPVISYLSNLNFDNARRGISKDLSDKITGAKESSSGSKIIEFLRQSGAGVSDLRVLDAQEDEDTREKSKRLQAGLSQVFADVFGSSVEFGNLELESKKIELRHEGVGGNSYFLPEGAESTGTIRLLNALPGVFESLENGSFIAIDELEMGLHTKAAELLIGLFASSETNPKGAQLLATTHDTNLLDSSYLRRDQVWFTEKTRDGKTALFPLSDFKVRKGDSMERGYLQGRFGAIPRGSIESLVRQKERFAINE
jgi:hypothetical protein